MESQTESSSCFPCGSAGDMKNKDCAMCSIRTLGSSRRICKKSTESITCSAAPAAILPAHDQCSVSSRARAVVVKEGTKGRWQFYLCLRVDESAPAKIRLGKPKDPNIAIVLYKADTVKRLEQYGYIRVSELEDATSFIRRRGKLLASDLAKLTQPYRSAWDRFIALLTENPGDPDTAAELLDSTYLVDKIVGQRTSCGKVCDLLVRWRGFGTEADSWESITSLSGCDDAFVAFEKVLEEAISRLRILSHPESQQQEDNEQSVSDNNNSAEAKESSAGIAESIKLPQGCRENVGIITAGTTVLSVTENKAADHVKYYVVTKKRLHYLVVGVSLRTCISFPLVFKTSAANTYCSFRV